MIFCSCLYIMILFEQFIKEILFSVRIQRFLEIFQTKLVSRLLLFHKDLFLVDCVTKIDKKSEGVTLRMLILLSVRLKHR